MQSRAYTLWHGFLLGAGMSRKENNIIPQQQTGASTDTVSEVKLDNEDTAKALYQLAQQRLLHVNEWHQVAGAATAMFQLTDEIGTEVNRAVKKGDHFKIDIPGPGTITGEGYDWVQVEEVQETNSKDEDYTAVRVRPATNPTNERQDVAHFFTEEASSSFIVRRKGTVVYAEVHGRNEKPNTEAEKVIDKTRNAAVAAGAISGFAKLQWKSLVNGLIKQ